MGFDIFTSVVSKLMGPFFLDVWISCFNGLILSSWRNFVGDLLKKISFIEKVGSSKKLAILVLIQIFHQLKKEMVPKMMRFSN